MKLKAFLLIATLHFAALASCAKETPETPASPLPEEEGYKTIDLSGYRLIFSRRCIPGYADLGKRYGMGKRKSHGTFLGNRPSANIIYAGLLA